MSLNHSHRPPVEATSNAKIACRRLKSRWVRIGFLAGCLPPILLGVYGLYAESARAASGAPGELACGMGELAALLFIFPIAPSVGVLGAAVGWILAASVTPDVQPQAASFDGEEHP